MITGALCILLGEAIFFGTSSASFGSGPSRSKRAAQSISGCAPGGQAGLRKLSLIQGLRSEIRDPEDRWTRAGYRTQTFARSSPVRLTWISPCC